MEVEKALHCIGLHSLELSLFFAITRISCLVSGCSESFINQNFLKLSFYPAEDKEIRVSNKTLFDWGKMILCNLYSALPVQN